MTAICLTRRYEGKIWGRRDLPDWVGPVPADRLPLGELIFDSPSSDHELLVKYLFTTERLSIQVHPDDRFAAALGHKRGKDEAWLVLWAGKGAELGIGPVRSVSADDLGKAARSGDIEGLVRWWPVEAGNSFYAPAGTIHAIGGELILLEIQQNMDVTYRLYDYGRPRPLHLDDGLAVARTGPVAQARFTPRPLAEGREVIADGPAFTVERWSGSLSAALDGSRRRWLVPLTAGVELDGRPAEPGSTWIMEGAASLALEEGAKAVLACPKIG